ncbi:anti-sigma factor [Pandoraea terrae]|uniref:Anti-sigma factor n=1 Tax=Pandoraea terrae TaxID=1537710 RepID=A0A5E4VCI2_9BURK|nr:cupin domain-containing protein [Pandoraea terrae]VVE09856.1 anti-sigma factor [Pandoraea terrae]
MLVNSDFSRRAIVTPDQYVWVPSPQRGVERVMLDRIGAEKARATSIVRYASNSIFPAHSHPGGEEILVLSGTFSEGKNDYPQGWYLRNPPGSAHQPSSGPGAMIFVKLMQMPAASGPEVRIDTSDPVRWRTSQGRTTCHLHTDDTEHVELLHLDGGEPVFKPSHLQDLRLAELLVLQGELDVDGASHPAGSWIRLPAGDAAKPAAGPHGTTVYVKRSVPVSENGGK